MAEQEDTASYAKDIIEVDIWQYLWVLRRNWLPAWLTFLVCVGLSAFAAVYTNRPVYLAQGKLLFQETDPNSELTGVGLELAEIDSIGRSNPLETQAKLLVSRSLLSQVIQNLDLRDDLGAYLDPSIFEQKIVVRQVPNTDILAVAYQSPDQQLPAQFVNNLMQTYVENNTSAQQEEVITARSFIERELPRLKEEADFASEALERFKTENQIVSLEDETRSVANLIGEFNLKETDIGIQLTAAVARATDLRRQLSMDAESALAMSTVSDSAAVQEVLTQLQAVETELAEQQALYLPNHPNVANLQRRADSLRSLLQERLALVLGSQVRQVPQQNFQLGSLQQQLIANLVAAESDSLVLQSQIEALRTLKAAYQQRADELPRLEKEQQELERNLDSAQSRYSQFLDRLQELSLAANQLQGSNQVRIIDQAITPDSPISSLNSKLLIAGFGAGVILAVMVAFGLDLLDPKVKTVKELEKILDYQLLGIIPRFETAEVEPMDTYQWPQNQTSEVIAPSPRIIAFSRNPGFAYEAYQRLHADLRITSVHNKTPRVLLVTSSSPAEGKSEMIANLAATMAQAGRRVLLIDADLRASSQHRYWNLENKVGTTHILSGSADINEARHSITSNLDIITSGIAVADPMMLLESPKVLSLVQLASQEYDYVLFDAPPVVPVPDALVLGKNCEGILFVARPKAVEVTSTLAAKRLLSKAKLPIVGIVATAVERSDVDRSLLPFAGGYGRYGYGYGYGQSTSEPQVLNGLSQEAQQPTRSEGTQKVDFSSEHRE